MKPYLITFTILLFSNAFSQQPATLAQQTNSENVIPEIVKQDTIIKCKIKPEVLIRSHKEKIPKILTIEIGKSDLYDKDNTIDVSVDEKESTFLKTDYEITKDIKNKKVTDNEGNHELTITLLPNTDNETAKKKLILNLTISTPQKKQYSKKITVIIAPENDTLNNFRYLAYIGTNFDLVDGIKAKNLFFATNIFIAPSDGERTGFYFSLYGNRTSTFRDSIDDHRRELRAVRADASNNLYAVYETSDLKIEGYSDNLGVYIAPLIRLWKQKPSFQFYYSPSTEFVWRRNVQNSTWYNVRLSDPVYNVPDVTQYPSGVEFPQRYRATYTNNVYDWNLGVIGVFLNHESDRMSIRLNINTGPSWRYETSITDRGTGMTRGGDVIEPTYHEDTDFFFSGKLWLTERYTGLTLQAEVANYLDHTSPYYGVTLSKAIDFGKLANIFQPISR